MASMDGVICNGPMQNLPSEPRPERFDGRPLVVRCLSSPGVIALVLALALAAVLIAMRPPITRGQDFQLMHRFYKSYLRTSIRAGEWPLWNPYVSLGRPFLADPETAVFYPPTWIFVLLSETPALFIFLVFHFGLAAYFFLKLAARWTVPRHAAIGATLAYLLSGLLFGRLQSGQLGSFCGLAYWPAIFYFVERLREKINARDWIGLTLAAAGSFLSGNPQIFWLTAVALGLYILGAHLGSPWRENARHGLLHLGTVAGAFAFALLLCAAQLLPTIDLMAQSNRPAPNLQFSASFAMEVGQFASLFTFQPSLALLLEANLYIGVISAIVGLLGLGYWRDARVRGLWLLGTTGFLLALGQHTPVFAVIFHLFPSMGMFRVATRYGAFVPWALLLAGLIAWPKWGSAARARNILALVMVFELAAYGVTADTLYLQLALIAGGVMAVSSLAMRSLKQPAWVRAGGLWRYGLLAVMCIDSSVVAAKMWSAYKRVTPHQYLEAAISDSLHKKNLYPANGVPPRLFIPLYMIRPDSGMEYGFSNVTGYGALTAMRVWSYLLMGTGLPPESTEVTFFPDAMFAAGPFPFPEMNIAAGMAGGTRKLVFNDHPGERAYLAYSWEQVPDWTAALRRMILRQVDPRCTLLEAPATGPAEPGAKPPFGDVVIDSFHRNSLSLQVHSSASALLMVAEAWSPGWRATVNGRPVEVLPANVWMRAVAVPAGESRVEMYYVEPSLARGAAISLAAWLVLMAIGWRSRRRPSL
jgi:hypothetical protein